MRHSAILVFANKQDLVSWTLQPVADQPLLKCTDICPESISRIGRAICSGSHEANRSTCFFYDFAQAGAVTTAELCDALGLQELKNRKWHVQGSIAIKGEGLYEVIACSWSIVSHLKVPICFWVQQYWWSLMDVVCFVFAGIGLVGKHPENHAENGADKRHRSSTLREWQHGPFHRMLRFHDSCPATQLHCRLSIQSFRLLSYAVLVSVSVVPLGTAVQYPCTLAYSLAPKQAAFPNQFQHLSPNPSVIDGLRAARHC